MMTRRLCPLLVSVFLVLHGAVLVWGKSNFRQMEKKILDSIIGPGRYDSRIRPHGINNTDVPLEIPQSSDRSHKK
ncbi:uncharacterized protein LOC118182527 [Stegodyphus dumicola]|uniref:uncharacterized protein LOC118182527 n=1 Tax=Stegodyphus dumicola TaxID=202533 RepID=UPI0015B0FCDA|nr:uncharacterized protein LOC118182527 [Stegodyphus dumicola]